MKQYKSIFLALITIVSFFNVTVAKVAPSVQSDVPPMGGALPDFNNPAFKQQLEEEMKAFEALPPEQQQKMLEAEFEQMMQDPEFKKTFEKIEEFSQTPEGKELFDKIEQDGDISEDEFSKLLEHMEQPIDDPSVSEKDPEETVVEKPKAEPKPVITDKDLQTATILTDLIARTASFITKSGQVIDLPAKVQRWSKKYPSFTWKSDLTWNTFHDDLEKLTSQLQTLLDKDPKTNSYRHIKNLVADQALLNNISKVHQVIIDVEPKIEDASLDKKLSKSSKENLRKAIAQYIEALYVLNLSSDITQLITAFDAAAKKLTEAEEKAIKQADIESKKPRQPGRAITAGQSNTSEYSPYDYGYDDYDAYDTYSPSYSPSSYNAPSYSPSAYESSSYNSPTSSSGGSSQPAQPERTKSSGKPSSNTDETPQAPKTGSVESSNSDRKDNIQEPPSVRLVDQKPEGINEIVVNIKKIDKKIEEIPQFKNLKKYLTGDEPVSPKLTNAIDDIVYDLTDRKTGIIPLVEKLKIDNKNNKTNLASYKEKINKALKEANNLTKLETQINTIIKDLDEPSSVTINDEKLQTYLPNIFNLKKSENSESAIISSSPSLDILLIKIQDLEVVVKNLTLPPKKK